MSKAKSETTKSTDKPSTSHRSLGEQADFDRAEGAAAHNERDRADRGGSSESASYATTSAAGSAGWRSDGEQADFDRAEGAAAHNERDRNRLASR